MNMHGILEDEADRMREKSTGVLPPGAHVCPEATNYLRWALHSLNRGLVVSAWRWAEKARAELDKVTDGETPTADGSIPPGGML
jgi:hypothetical protein